MPFNFYDASNKNRKSLKKYFLSCITRIRTLSLSFISICFCEWNRKFLFINKKKSSVYLCIFTCIKKYKNSKFEKIHKWNKKVNKISNFKECIKNYCGIDVNRFCLFTILVMSDYPKIYFNKRYFIRSNLLKIRK